MPRYRVMEYLVALVALLIVGRALYIMTVKRDYWMQVADRVKLDSVKVAPARGNILSCDGQLMASSLPEFKLFMDFKALHDSGNDSLWTVKEDSVVNGLAQIFPDKKPSDFRKHLEEGHKKLSRHWPVWSDRVDYGTYKDVKMLPVFKLPAFQSGFHVEEFNARRRPYGSLASRTVGELYGAKDTARFGLELSYDSILRGSNGIINRQKVLSKFLNIMVTPPTDGADIVTTIDVGIQDLAERSLIKELESINADVGVAIVMEVATGDIKAIVNMDKCFDGKYREIKNHAVSDLLEPGSVFKPVSIMTALDDGVVDTTYHVETGTGQWPMYGRMMNDHNWSHGGYGLLSLPQTLQYSSNIGVSRIIDGHYHNDPEKFVRGVYRTGIADNLHIPLVGSSPAKIRFPKKNKRGEWINWSDTALPWMSIGYETQVPPISTLTFYNAIANGGKMVQPRFVKQVIKDGEVIMDFPVRVLREHICKDKTLGEMQTILDHVVSQGLGHKAGSSAFKVAGKTGTAQISQGSAGYKGGTTHYLISFAGYFPDDNPRYSCIVCIQKRGTPASGGLMCGAVFHDISEGIMAQDIRLDVRDARDSLSILVPDVKSGNILAADYVLSHLGIKANTDWNGSYANGNPVWGHAQKHGNHSVTLQRLKVFGHTFVPDVSGMGARDAVFMLESRGIRTRLNGRGKVVSQSLAPGTKIKKRQRCLLTLE